MVPTSATPRSLTQMLREWDDAAVARLLLSRPDLAFPPPTDFSQIASRATTRHSVAAALDGLTAFDLWVAERLCGFSRSVSAADLAAEGVDERDLEDALGRLLGLSLVWGDVRALRPVRALSSLLGQREPAEAPSSAPPVMEPASVQSPPLVDKVAAGSAFEFVRRMEVLVEHCDHQPARLTRTGSLSSRDLRGLAGLLDLPTAVTTAHLEIAQSAGLLGLGARDLNEVLIPTTAFDAWQEASLGDQWRELTDAWFRHHRPSGPEWLKRLCLRAFGDPAEGRVLTVEQVRSWLAWHRPRRSQGSDRQASTLLDQAAWIGVTGLGALSSFAADVDGTGLEELLPPRVDHVLVQADFTAIAPGPLTPDAARDLGALADVESRGGATVYRFSPPSLLRAHRLGWSVDDVLRTLEARSRTPLPQALTYLVHDLARQQTATPATDEGPGEPPATRRAPAVRGIAMGVDADADPAGRLDSALVADILSALRDVDPAEPDGDTRPHADVASDVPLDTLREAVESGEVVWFGFVDTVGATGERLVHALSVDEGLLSAEDATTRQPLTVPLHRITSAHIIRGTTS